MKDKTIRYLQYIDDIFSSGKEHRRNSIFIENFDKKHPSNKLDFKNSELLNRSISFASSITTISDSVINIIHHSRKSLLSNNHSYG